MSARSCATFANHGREVAAADDSVNNYKAVNRLVHERARKSAISHWHGESQPSIAPLVRLVYRSTLFSKVATNAQTTLVLLFINPPKTTLNGMCIMNATPAPRDESRNRAAKLKCGS